MVGAGRMLMVEHIAEGIILMELVQCRMSEPRGEDEEAGDGGGGDGDGFVGRGMGGRADG